MYQFMSATALVLSLGGNVLINSKKRIGFSVWVVSNLCWIVVNIIAVQTNWFQIFMFAVYIGLNIQGFISWKKNKRDVKSSERRKSNG